MQQYPFLILCIITLVPSLFTAALRRDLTIHMARMALISLPFAFTEFMFYPDYWDPPFLFNAAARLGFGLEDFLFVAAIGAISIGLYPSLLKQKLQHMKPQSSKQTLLKILTLSGSALFAAVTGWAAGLPAIYTALLIMMVMPSAVLLKSRPDLIRHSLKSGLVSLAAYTAVCLMLELLLPGTFDLYWHTGNLMNVYTGPLPLEELLYGFATGFATATLYPFAFGLEFAQYSPCPQKK